MKKNLLLDNLAYILAGVFNLGIIGFLFAPLLTYKIKVDGVKTQFNVNILKMFDSSITPTWIGGVFVGVIAIAAIALVFSFVMRKNEKVKDVFDTILLIFLGIIFVLCFMNKEVFAYFAGEYEVAKDTYGMIPHFNSAAIGWGSSLILFLTAFEFVCAISFSNFSNQSLKGIAEDGMLIAAAFVLNFIKIPLGSTGGSVNFQMLPLMIIALRRGPLNGFICGGVIYGLLTCISDGYGFATYPFDYLIGFGSVAVVGLFKPLIFPKDDSKFNTLHAELFILLAGVLSTLVRFIGGTVSSMAIYGYKFVPAMAYNALYIPLSGAAAIIFLMLLLPALKQINHRFPAEGNNQFSEEEPEELGE
ncbi:MAG: energy-coupled thiamine transporter ThiT [Bacilli bacterium]|nr:energy-coupled thiamine transporter ThiT [Bacilli bacterium]